MTRSLKLLASVAALLLCAGSTRGLRATSASSSHQTGEWAAVNGWPRLPRGFGLGEVSGVALNSRGNVILFHRADGEFDRERTAFISSPTILEIDRATGVLLKSWGAGLFIIPHSLTVDRQDNVWVTDDRLHQVLKFSRDGHLLMTVGEKRVPGWDGSHFNEPTDVVILKDRSFLVSDGYQNSRIAHFGETGKFISEWGALGDGPGQFRIPHGIAVDSFGTVYVADRQNSRLQVFDSTGRFSRIWPPVSAKARLFDVALSAGGLVYLALKDGPAAVVILDHELNEIGNIPFDSANFVTPHAIAVDGDSTIYLADTGGHRITKFVRR